MNYKQHYQRMIERAKLRETEGYSEKHHILPKCLGGKNDVDNIVKLLPEEHYVAHQLLVKMHPYNSKLIYAANLMTRDAYGHRVKNKQFGWLKRREAIATSSTKKGVRCSDETKIKISNALKGKRQLTKISEYTSQKISEGLRKRVFTDATRLKMSESKKGTKLSNETKNKISEAQKGGKRSEETKDRCRYRSRRVRRPPRRSGAQGSRARRPVCI